MFDIFLADLIIKKYLKNIIKKQIIIFFNKIILVSNFCKLVSKDLVSLSTLLFFRVYTNLL